MTEPIKNENVEGAIPENVYEISRKVLLAAVGAAAIAQEEISNFVDHLAEHGEFAENEARSLVKEVMEHREKVIRQRREEIQKRSRNNATKADVEDLKTRINELNKQLEELKKS